MIHLKPRREVIVVKVKTKCLANAALDWAIAKCESLPVVRDPMGFKAVSESGYWVWDERNKKPIYMLIGREYSPSKKWEQGGAFIEKYDVFPSRYHGCAENNPEKFQAGVGLCWMRGESPLIAVSRSVVASVLGDEIEVPEILVSRP
jgi:hypothetical protein